MTDLSPEIAPDIAAACTQNLAEIVETLSRTLDQPVEAAVGEPGVYQAGEPPEGWDGAGLVVLMAAGGVAAGVVLPASTGLVPDWVTSPDATGESRLATLAQELSLLVLPETVLADDFQAAWAENIGEALTGGGLEDGAALAPLTLTAGEASGTLSIALPVPTPAAVFPEAADETPGEPDAEPASEAAPTPAAGPAGQRPADLHELPALSRSLLKVAVPVTVCLASKLQAVDEIVELGPGSIISFDKSCEDPVELTVGDQTIGLGEVVKVGEHFGIRIDTMVLPDESFKAIRPKAS